MDEAALIHRPLSPRLIGRPPGWTLEDLRGWVADLDDTWQSLARYGGERLARGGWRRLGIGAVHAVSELFERLARPICVVWSTLDAPDPWGQTVVQIALRQRCWFTPRTRPILGALSTSYFDLYRVIRHTDAELLLQRARDERRLSVNATFDDGAYPRDRYVVARLIFDGVACASLASTVVSRATIGRALGRGTPESRRGWSQVLFDVALDDLARVAARSRHDLAEPAYVGPGPWRMRRLHRAFDALESELGSRSTPRYEFNAAGGSVSAEIRRARTQVVVTRPVGSRVTLRRVSAEAFATADRAIARQAGLVEEAGLLCGIEELAPGEWAPLLDLIVTAARHLHQRGRQRAA